MGRRCEQELCPMWDGDGCPCAAFGLDPDDLPTDGIFTITAPTTPPASRGQGEAQEGQA